MHNWQTGGFYDICTKAFLAAASQVSVSAYCYTLCLLVVISVIMLVWLRIVLWPNFYWSCFEYCKLLDLFSHQHTVRNQISDSVDVYVIGQNLYNYTILVLGTWKLQWCYLSHWSALTSASWFTPALIISGCHRLFPGGAHQGTLMPRITRQLRLWLCRGRRILINHY